MINCEHITIKLNNGLHGFVIPVIYIHKKNAILECAYIGLLQVGKNNTNFYLN